jgi:hypothetical protein
VNVILKIYIQHIMKKMFLPYVLLITGIAVILFLTLSIKIDVMQTFNGQCIGNKVRITTVHKIDAKKIYTYIDRNVKIYSSDVKIEYFENGTETFNLVGPSLPHDVQGKVSVDISVGKQSLFSLIFKQGGKS